MLNSLGFSHSRLAPAAMKPQLINARPIYWLCVVQSVCICRGFPPVAFARTDNSGRPILRLHALTLIVPKSCDFGDGLCVLARTIQFSKNRPTGRPRDARIPRRSTIGWPADRV
jgi:hypothetical protein